MHKMTLCIDEREQSLYDAITDLMAVHQQGNEAHVVITKKVLPLGDIVLEHADGRTAMLFERKALADLLSSIRDSRYEEQSYRLTHSSGLHPHNVVYIIEGVMGQLGLQKNRDLVYSAMTSLSHYKGFSVFRTSSVQETAQMLWAIANKVHRNTVLKKTPKFGIPTGAPVLPTVSGTEDPGEPTVTLDVPPVTEPPPPYCSVVKRIKKDNVTPDNWGEIVLCQIPGVSTVSAVAIMKQYKTLSQLMLALQSDPHCLDGLHIASASGPRKLSSGIVANLCKFLVAP